MELAVVPMGAEGAMEDFLNAPFAWMHLGAWCYCRVAMVVFVRTVVHGSPRIGPLEARIVRIAEPALQS